MYWAYAIVQSSRPRSVMTPTLFGVGVEMDHVFGSKWLINELSHLGFSVGYDEVGKYKQSVIQSETLETLLSEYISGMFTQWVADNNVITLDGQGTFHGMGIVLRRLWIHYDNIVSLVYYMVSPFYYSRVQSSIIKIKSIHACSNPPFLSCSIKKSLVLLAS